LNMPFDVFYVVLTGRFIHTDGRKYSKDDFEETLRVMAQTDIIHLKDRQFNELSGGEKQRVLLARTINKNTKIVLLDEPFSDTDILHQHKLIGLLKELAKDKLIIVVIHDLSLAVREFERFLFFESGRLSYDAMREEIDEERLSGIFGVNVNFIKEGEKLFVDTRLKANS
ncbi:ATP-binding cassette domain-containing protein, partial [Thermodesulfobacteriota bacterium]